MTGHEREIGPGWVSVECFKSECKTAGFLVLRAKVAGGLVEGFWGFCKDGESVL